MRFLIKMYNINGKMVHKYASANKNRFSAKLSLALKIRDNISRYFLKIIYKRDYENAGNYENKKDLLSAYNVFTEPDLMRYMGG